MSELHGLPINANEVRSISFNLRHSHSADDRDLVLLKRAMLSSSWSNAALVAEFERAFASYCGAKHCLLVVNATIALKLGLIAIGVEEGSEVIVPGMTWPSVLIAVIECGAVPVPVDLSASSYAMTLDSIEAATTSRTRAIIATHLYNSQTEIAGLLEFAKSRGIALVEDAAHALGTTKHGGAMFGTLGDFGIYSFNDKKVLAAGEAGCLVTDSDELYASALSMREVDSNSEHRPRRLVSTSKVSEFQAAILISQLARLPEKIRQISANEQYLRELLNEVDGISPLKQAADLEVVSPYSFCFRLLRKPRINFRSALSDAVGFQVSGTYRSVNHCASLRPLQQTPHVREVAARLDCVLPVCERAFAWEGIRFHHGVLCSDRSFMEMIADRIGKCVKNFL
jgi:dTDP-4-amino-4,6-dideoxygalactose transaminase